MRITRTRLIALVFGLMAFGSWAPLLWIWSEGVMWSGAAGRAMSVWYPVPALVATLFVQGPLLKQPILEPLGLRMNLSRWWLVAWLLPVLILVIGMVVTSAAGFELTLTTDQLIENKRSLRAPAELQAFDDYLAEHTPPHPLMLIVLGLPAGLTINLIFALCEEVAFRGFFFREVPGQFWLRSFLIGCLWWAWLAPSVALGNLYGRPGLLGVALAFPWCVVASWMLVYIRVRADSLIPVAIARGTIIALTGAAHDLTFGAPSWLQPFYGIAGLVGLGVIVLAFYAHDRTKRARLMTTDAAT